MSVAVPTPEALARQWFEELWNQGREETIDKLLFQQIGLLPTLG